MQAAHAVRKVIHISPGGTVPCGCGCRPGQRLPPWP